ncbi:uncharacterized protein LOC133912380 [Phragmites australis]|uniref:uncharacterized protein LOC133912380 n=1 Tax=Phragmites australis TaxID=29695 RepID=UPI002D78AAD4|nr:uncharacterized protein LOC133912380 [Phragmites australis]
MDSKLSVQHGHNHNNGISKPPVHHHHGGGKRSGRQQGGGGKGIKVVYISSPMKLTASAEEFRAIVQEFTGRDSNVADHDLAAAAHLGASSSSSSSSSYSSFGRASPTAPSAEGAHALRPTIATASAISGRAPAEYAADVGAQPMFQGMYDRTGSLLYGQDYW